VSAGATPAVEADGVSARYERAGVGPHERPALADVSLVVRSGQIVALLGPNGAGKSTLLRVLAGTLAPVEGEVRLFGAPIKGRGRRELAREVAFVMQSEEVRFPFRVREVVLMGRAPHQGRAMSPSPEDARVVSEALERFDLATLADRPMDELSGGEKKRVAIARAFAQAPRLLLLDEPTAFLDVRHQVALVAELRGLAVARGVASIVVTHDLQLAAAAADRVLLMKEGRALAWGGVDDVLTAPRLEEAFDCAIEAGRLEGTSTRVFAPVLATSQN
jgi:iron complex transport system ATP-binding protein